MTVASTVDLAGWEVRRIGFGAMQLPGPRVFGPPADPPAAVALLRRAVELGVNHIDTSDYYGPHVANELLREALHPYPHDLALVSKVGARRDETGGWHPWDAPADLRTGIEDNLRRLDVERLAAVNLRLMDQSTQDFDAQLEAMATARADGLIDGIGLSNVSLAQLEHALTCVPVSCVQNSYNLFSRESTDLLTACGERGIPFVPYFPLGSAFPGARSVVTDPVVRSVADRLGCTSAQVGLAWLLAQGPHVLLIPGTSSLTHLEQNLAAGSVTLDQAALDALS
ncbi:MAG: oxidoreductase [Actinomycetota bacterium]|nr:oxidoreductase [Actinomycetota bacterium]